MGYSQIKDFEMNLWKFAPNICEKKEHYNVSDTFDNGYFCAKSKCEALSSFLEHLDGSINCIEDGQNVLDNLDKIEKVLKYWIVNRGNISLISKNKTTTTCFPGADYILEANLVLLEDESYEQQIIICFEDNKMSAIIKRDSFVRITGTKEYIAEIKRNETIRKEKTKIYTTKEHSHNGNGYRSKTEIKICDALESEGCLFYPNNACRIKDNNGQYINKETDFLICHKGNWGILEVDGEMWHTSAAKDHARDDLFNAHGIWFIKRYPASECWESPNKVVKHFLSRMEQFYSQR